MFDLVVLGIPSVATLGEHTLSQLMRKKFPITFRNESGEERVEECVCSPSNDHCEEGEYAVLLQLDHPMIRLNIFVIVNEATGEGRITMSRPAGGEVNPWVFLPPSVNEEQRVFKALCLRLDSPELKRPELNRYETRNLRQAINQIWIGLRRGDFQVGNDPAPYLWQICERERKFGWGPRHTEAMRKLVEANGLTLHMDLTRFRDRLPPQHPT